MKRALTLLIALVTVAALVQPDVADAARLGGGKSFGAQRSITPSSPPSTASPYAGGAANPVMPAQPGASAARPAAPAAGAAAAPAAGASRWLGPIAGIAAGLGLAALFSHLGLSEAFGSVLLMILLAGVALFVIRALLARRGAAQAPMRYAPQGAGAPARVEPSVQRFEPVFGGGSASAAPTATRRYPPGFDPVPFVAEAKRQFLRLQQAYDRGDRSMLADVLTPEMLAEVGRDIEARGAHVPTEVLALEGDVLDVATEGSQHWASVRFTGRTREDGRGTPEPFDEVWNLVKPVDGSTGWRLAGIQQYA